jgi:hypothetical protein
LVEDVVGSFLVGKVIETGFIEAISKNFRRGDAAPSIEKKLEATSVTRGVGVCNRLGVAEGVEERAKGTNLVSDLRLPFGVGGEPEDLVYEEVGAEALSGACDPPYTRNASAKTTWRFAQRPHDGRT